MDSTQQFKLNNTFAYIAAIVLIACFVLVFAFNILPNLPNYPKQPDEWRWYAISWNLGGPLMFIIIFRIHTLRVLGDIIRKGRVALGVTLWVKFWFGAALFFGLATLPFVFQNYVVYGATSIFANAGAALVIFAWLSLIASSIALLRIRCSKAMLLAVENAREVHRVLLAPASIIFFIFTGLSSITILFP
ncbi:MAG: hypothetical protein ACETWO_01745 [Candidatus Hadarchaeaceae archaeon]